MVSLIFVGIGCVGRRVLWILPFLLGWDGEKAVAGIDLLCTVSPLAVEEECFTWYNIIDAINWEIHRIRANTKANVSILA